MPKVQLEKYSNINIAQLCSRVRRFHWLSTGGRSWLQLGHYILFLIHFYRQKAWNLWWHGVSMILFQNIYSFSFDFCLISLGRLDNSVQHTRQVVFQSWIIKNLNLALKPQGNRNLGKIDLDPYFFWANSMALLATDSSTKTKQNTQPGSNRNNDFSPKNLMYSSGSSRGYAYAITAWNQQLILLPCRQLRVICGNNRMKKYTKQMQLLMLFRQLISSDRMNSKYIWFLFMKRSSSAILGLPSDMPSFCGNSVNPWPPYRYSCSSCSSSSTQAITSMTVPYSSSSKYTMKISSRHAGNASRYMPCPSIKQARPVSSIVSQAMQSFRKVGDMLLAIMSCSSTSRSRRQAPMDCRTTCRVRKLANMNSWKKCQSCSRSWVMTLISYSAARSSQILRVSFRLSLNLSLLMQMAAIRAWLRFYFQLLNIF